MSAGFWRTCKCGGRRLLRIAAWSTDSCCRAESGAAAAASAGTVAAMAGGGAAKFGRSIRGFMVRSRILSKVFAAWARLPRTSDGQAGPVDSFMAGGRSGGWGVRGGSDFPALTYGGARRAWDTGADQGGGQGGVGPTTASRVCG